MQTVVCRIHGQGAAKEAVRLLQEGGFAPASVEVQNAIRSTWQSMKWQFGRRKNVPRLRRGESFIIVRTADEHSQRAAGILRAAGASDVKVHVTQARR